MKKLIEVETKNNAVLLTLLWVVELLGCIVATILEANIGLYVALAMVNLICVICFGIFSFAEKMILASVAMGLFNVTSLLEFCINIEYISDNPSVLALLLLPILGVISLFAVNNCGKITMTDKGIIFEQRLIGGEKILRTTNIPIEKVCFVKKGLFKSIIIAAPSGRICAYQIKEIEELFGIISKLANKDEDTKSE